MILLHAHWDRSNLHLWGMKSASGDDPDHTRLSALEPGAQATDGPNFQWPISNCQLKTEDTHKIGNRQSAKDNSCTIDIRQSPIDNMKATAVPRDGDVGRCFVMMRPDELRRQLGECWDALTVSSGTEREIAIPVPDAADVSEHLSAASGASVGSTRSVRIPTIAFEPDDSVELLWHAARTRKEGLTDTLRFWIAAAQLTREILALQRYVPAIMRLGGEYHGYWRALLDGEQTRARIRALAATMPPVCRVAVPSSSPTAAEELVVGFIYRTVDSMVRRCMEDDELTHLLMSTTAREPKPVLLWLGGLIGTDSRVHASYVECERLHERIATWTSALDTPSASPRFIAGFRLESPQDPTSTQLAKLWRLTIHLVARDDPSQIFDAAKLLLNDVSQTPEFPLSIDPLLPRLRSDLARASRYFSPLSACAAQDGPLEANLSLSEAYFFLREAAPLLRSEGFKVWTPDWWTESAPRPRMRLSLRPNENGSAGSLDGIGINELVRYDWELAIGEETLTREELTLLAESKEPLVRLRGRWVEAAQAEIEIARKYIAEHGSGESTLFDILRRCYLSDDLALGVPFGGVRAQGWVQDVLDAGDASTQLQEFSPPRAFRGELRPYQLRGLQWMVFMSRIGVGACLADDMGLGKTIQLIALLLHEREPEASPGPTLLVGPMSLVGNWQREIQRFAPSLKVLVHHGLERLTGDDFVQQASQHDVVISTYALTHRDFEPLSRVQWHRVALDEAQCIKNPAAKQAAAVRMLPTRHRIALTGTPVENRLSELWSIMDFLNPGYLGTAADFRRRMAIPIERHHDSDHAARLRTLIRPFILRRLKNDPLVQVDLPPKMEMKVFCNLTREQAALYEAVVSDMLRRVTDSEGIQRRGLILATLTKLKQICNHPVQFLGDATELAERSGKCERLGEMLGEVLAEGDQALIFTQYREMGELLVGFLKRTLDSEILFLHGGTSRVERDRLVQRFQQGDRAPLLILSLKAGGFGLNLTAAAHVFHFDRWWNPAVEDQATDRAHRIGQVRTVQVHKLVCIGTLEERIDAMLEQKRQLADQIIGSGEAWLTELSTDQFRDLITLSQDAIGE